MVDLDAVPTGASIRMNFLQNVRSWIVLPTQVVRTMCRSNAMGRNAGVRPAGHAGAGKPSWWFADEIIVRA